MTTNKMSRIFLLLVLSTLASSQELADPFSPRNLDEPLIDCKGKFSVCVSPVTYKYCAMDGKGQWIAIGSTLRCDNNMRCVNDGVDICVPLKTSTQAPLIQTSFNTTSSVTVSSSSTEAPISPSNSLISSSTSSSVATSKSNDSAINTGPPVEVTKVAVETTNAPVQTTVTGDIPQVNTVATEAASELSPLDIEVAVAETTILPQETTKTPLNFYDTSITESADSSFNIMSTTVPTDQSGLVDATKPHNSTEVVGPNKPTDLNLNTVSSTSPQADLNVAQTSDAPDVITSAPIETSSPPVETVYTSDNPVLTPVNSGMPLVPIAPVDKNASSDITVEAVSTNVDPSPRQTTLPSDPTLLEDRTTVAVDQTSIPTVYNSEAAPTVSADKNTPEEESLISVDPATLDELSVASIPKIPTTPAPEPTNTSLPVTSTLSSSAQYPQVIINERDITNVSSGVIPLEVAPNVLNMTNHTNLTNDSLPPTLELEPSTQANTISPLDSTNVPLSTSSQQTNPKIPLDSSVLVGTSLAPIELTRPSNHTAEVEATPSILEKPVVTAIESLSNDNSSASVTSSPLNIITAVTPNIIATSKAQVDLNSLHNLNSTPKPNEPVSSTSSANVTPISSTQVTPSAAPSSIDNPNITSEPDETLVPNASIGAGANPKTTADSNKPLTTNIAVDSSVTVVHNNTVQINTPNTSHKLVTSVNPVAAADPTTATQPKSPAQPSTDQSMLSNTDVKGAASLSLNPNTSAFSNAAVSTDAPTNTLNSIPSTSASAEAVANNLVVSSSVPAKPGTVPSISDIPSIASEPSVPLGPNTSVTPGVIINNVVDSNAPLTTDIAVDSSVTAVHNNTVEINIPNTSNTPVTSVNRVASADPTIATQQNSPAQPSTDQSVLSNTDVRGDASLSLNPNTLANSNAAANNNTPVKLNSSTSASATAVANNSGIASIASDPSAPLGPNASVSAGVNPNTVADSDVPHNTNIEIDSSATVVQDNNVVVNIPNASTSVDPNNSAVSSSAPSEPNAVPGTSNIPSIVSDPSKPLGPNASVSAGVNPNETADPDVPLATDIDTDSSATVAQDNSVVVNIPNASSTLGTTVNTNNLAVSSSVPAKPSVITNTPDLILPLNPSASVSAGVNPNTVADPDVPLSTNYAIDSNATAIQNNKVAVNILNNGSKLGTTVNPIAAADPITAAKPSLPIKPITDPNALGNKNVPDSSVSLNPSASVNSIVPVNTNTPLTPYAINSGSSTSTTAAGAANSSGNSNTAGSLNIIYLYDPVYPNVAVTSSVPSELSAIPSTSNIPSIASNPSAPLNPNVSAGVNPNATADSGASLSSNLAINSNAAAGQNILIDSSAQGIPNVDGTYSPINPITSADANTAAQVAADPTTLGDPHVASGVGVLLNPNASASSNAPVNTNEPETPNAVNINSSGILNSQGDLVSSRYPNALLTPSVSTDIVKANTTIKSSGSVSNVADKPSKSVSTSSDSYTPIVPTLPTDSNGPSNSNSKLAHHPNTTKKPESIEDESTESEETIKEKSDSNENSSKEEKSKEENDNKKNEKKKKKEEEKKKKEEEKKKRKEEEKKRKEERKKLKEEKRKNKNKKEENDNSGSSEDSDEEVLKHQNKEEKKLIKRILKNIKKNQCDEGDVYPDIKDCNKYYRCVERSGNTQFVHMHCDDDKLYDFEEQQCVDESQAQCLLKEE